MLQELRALIYSQSQSQGEAEGEAEEDHERQQQRQAQDEEEENAQAALLERGQLSAALSRRAMGVGQGMEPAAVRWRERGSRPSTRGAPLYHWPTSMLVDCQEMPVALHLKLMRKLLAMCVAAQDVPGVATALGLVQGAQPGVDVAGLEANTWVLTQLAAREEARTGGVKGGTDPTVRPQARRLVLFLRNAMGPRILLPPTAGDVGPRGKTVATPDPLRVLALSKLLGFLVQGGYLSYGRELLQQETFLRPFRASPHVHRLRALLACLEAALRARGKGKDQEEKEEDGLEAAFTRLVQDPRACLLGATGQRAQPRARRPQQGGVDVEGLVLDLDKATDDGAKGAVAAVAVRVALLPAPSRDTAHECSAVLHVVGAQCFDQPGSPRAHQLAYTALRAVRGWCYPPTLYHLKAWVGLDPTSDEAVRELVQAYRHQLLLSYRDPQAPVHVSRTRLVQALVDRLLTVAPSSSSSSSSLPPQPLRCFRWLAAYLGPVQTQPDTHQKPSIDWYQRAAVQEVLAGRYEAWSWACRGLEESATLELFHPASLHYTARKDAFAHPWHEVLDEAAWCWPPPHTSAKAKEQARLWGVIKHSPAGLHDGQEEEGPEPIIHAEEPPIAEQNDPDEALLATCARGDDDDAGELEGLDEEGAGALRHHLLLLAYKAVAAVHLMGPRNLYTVLAIRRMWDSSHPAAAPKTCQRLYGMLQQAFGLDVKGALHLSDAYIVAHTQVQAPPRLVVLPQGDGRVREGPLSLGLAEAATGWPLPALHPPRVLAPAFPTPSSQTAFRPQPLPSALDKACHNVLRKAFAQATRDREEGEAINKKRKAAGEAAGEEGAGAGGESGASSTKVGKT